MMNTLHMKASTLLWGGLIMLSGCSASPDDVNVDNFKAVLNAHYSNNLECFAVGASKDPNEYIYIS